MTKPPGAGGGGDGRCGWCGRPLPTPAATGRPRRWCRASCRQRAHESRARGREVGLLEHEVVLRRSELDELRGRLWPLEAAVEDTRRDLDALDVLDADADAGRPGARPGRAGGDVDELRRILGWLLEAAEHAVGRAGDPPEPRSRPTP